ncbi:MAG TPA: hydrogenase formation protein HypD [Planctomycetaceae bacterium]|nr:hydrogenase formation protein HypD [Planctomycetaceae bacterium]
MKSLERYRDPVQLRTRLDEVRRACTRRWTIMDVCGGQTHNLLRHGIENALSDCIELIHGPGCPVCVTPAAVIDRAIELALTHKVTLATFGDMLRVPGQSGSLLQTRARGGAVRTIYCPTQAVQLAQRHPDQQVVLLAIGFETTAPSTALAVLQAEDQRLTNFSVLAHHVRVEPAMRVLAADPGRRLQGFLAAGHVCTVTGYHELESLAQDFKLPVTVTGFEPLDLADGLLGCVQQLEQGRAVVENCYPRSVRREGNSAALRLLERVFAPDDLAWRGFGVIPQGGFVLRQKYEMYDAERRFDAVKHSGSPESRADHHCAAVLSGRMKPCACPLFGQACTPDFPQGAPMVSSEGACAAYFRYTGGPALR